MRFEYKYIVNYSEYITLKHRLSKLFSRDLHADAHGEYCVRSLYFDDSFDTALLNKINGISICEKFRIRFYNNDFSFIRLEKKSKVKNLYTKQSEQLSYEEVKSILNRDYSFMKESKSPLILEFYNKVKIKLLRPKTIVEYIREPFIFNPFNVRITLDKSIKTGLNSIDFLNKDLTLIKASQDYAILEVKFKEVLPNVVLDAIRLPNKRPTAFSKYAVSRRFD